MKVAVVQEAPVVLERAATLARAVTLVGQAAAEGAGLIVFPEAFIPGYPAWVWRLRPGGDWNLSEAIHARLLENAVDLSADELAPLREAAARHSVTIVCGIDERDGEYSRATLYNTVVTIDPRGEIVNRHRKLMPTNPERMVWGFGDASGLKVVETPAGRIGTLVCWENFMPLARFALYAQGIEIYIAPTYDSGDDWLGSLRHIAREGGCWVVGCGNALTVADLPDDFPGKAGLYPESEEWINPGDSIVIAPGGEVIAGPLRKQQAVLYAEIDVKSVGIARRTFDVAGHYSRPDIFSLHVNTRAMKPVAFD
jgi:nitrilase